MAPTRVSSVLKTVDEEGIELKSFSHKVLLVSCRSAELALTSINGRVLYNQV